MAVIAVALLILLQTFHYSSSLSLPRMKAQPSLSEAYFARLGLENDNTAGATATKLAKIQQAQLENVCFENLAQHGAAGGLPALDVNVTKEKILDRRRGGFCFEVNGLLAAFLEEQGYQVKRVPAKVCIGETDDDHKLPVFRGEPTHVVLLVTDCKGQEWFVDVGFGEPPMNPLRYPSLSESQTTPEGMQSRFVQNDDDATIWLQWFQEGRWKTRLEWKVADAKRNKPLQDYAPALELTLDDTSIFSQKLICCRLTPTTKKTLAGNRLKVTTPRFEEEVETVITTLESIEEIRSVLESDFGIPKDVTKGLDLSRSLQASKEIWSTM